jgi:hypothetical protein
MSVTLRGWSREYRRSAACAHDAGICDGCRCVTRVVVEVDGEAGARLAIWCRAGQALRIIADDTEENNAADSP